MLRDEYGRVSCVFDAEKAGYIALVVQSGSRLTMTWIPPIPQGELCSIKINGIEISLQEAYGGKYIGLPKDESNITVTTPNGDNYSFEVSR